MKSTTSLILALATAVVLGGCAAPATNAPTNANAANKNANSNANSSTAAAPPTKDALMALDKSAYDAWKSKNAAFWDTFLSANFVGYGASGRLDRASAMKEYAGNECDVKNVSFSDDQMTTIGNDVAIISYKVAVDGTCGGQKLPPESWAASAYVREGDKWKGAFHAETPVTDPNAPPAKSSAPAAATSPAAAASPAASTDAMADALMAVEKQAWEAWKARDAKAVEGMMGSDFTYLSGTGRKAKAEAIKAWSEPKCEGIAYTLSDPKSVSLSKDAALILYNADLKGSCDGKPLPAHIWVASFDQKEGDAWKNAFYMDSPR